MHPSVRDFVWNNAHPELKHHVLETMFQLEARADERFYWLADEPLDEVVFWRNITRMGDLRCECVRICINCGEATYPNRLEN